VFSAYQWYQHPRSHCGQHRDDTHLSNIYFRISSWFYSCCQPHIAWVNQYRCSSAEHPSDSGAPFPRHEHTTVTEAGPATTSTAPQCRRMLPPQRRYERKNKMQPVSEPRTIRYIYFSCQSTTYSYHRQFATVDWCASHPEGTEGDFNRWWDTMDEKSDAMQVGELDCRSTFILLTLISLGVQEEGEGRKQEHSQRPLGECNTLHCQ
jgi:hypothetical protein